MIYDLFQRNEIGSRFNTESENIDEANKKMVQQMQQMILIKSENDSLIANMQAEVENLAVQEQLDSENLVELTNNVTQFEERTPTNNSQLKEQHDSYQRKLNGLKQEIVDFKLKFNNQKVEQDLKINELRKKKQLLMKQLFPNDGKTVASSTESDISIFIDEKMSESICSLEPPVLKKIDVLNLSSRSIFTDNSPVSIFQD